jgi:hypothetical protein
MSRAPDRALSSICLKIIEMKMLSKSWHAFRKGSEALDAVEGIDGSTGRLVRDKCCA